MKKLRRILGLCLVLAASAGLVVACGPTTGNDCEFDSDCATGEVCLQPTGDSNRCVTECTDDATVCAADEECAPRFPNSGEGDRSACIPSDLECSVDTQCPEGINCGEDGFCAVNADEQMCESDEDCGADETCNLDTGMCESDATCESDEDCGQGETCNLDTGMCEAGQLEYFVVEITDTTDPNSDACTSPSDEDPGSDIMTAEILVDGADAGIWAQAIGWATTGDPKVQPVPPAHMTDRTAPTSEISAGTCPDTFDSSSLVSLGCGGKVWVVFASADGEVPISTDGTVDMFVYEYGAPLCGNDTSDTYQVELCDAPSRDDIANAEMPSDFDCSGPTIIEEGQGEGSAIDITVE